MASSPVKKETRDFSAEKVTPGTVRFRESVAEGEPPFIETIYIKKWWIGEHSKIRVTVEVIQ